MKRLKVLLGAAAAVALVAMALTGCKSDGVNGNGNICNNQQQCVSYSFSQHGNGSTQAAQPAATTQPATQPAPSTQPAIQPSASIPGATTSPTSPPPPTAAVPTSPAVPQEQFDASVHRCKQSSGVNTMVSLGADLGHGNTFVTCLQLAPDQANLLIQLLVVAVYDYLTGQPFNPPAQYANTPCAGYVPDIRGQLS